jgi:hypothetical protein
VKRLSRNWRRVREYLSTSRALSESQNLTPEERRDRFAVLDLAKKRRKAAQILEDARILNEALHLYQSTILELGGVFLDGRLTPGQESDKEQLAARLGEKLDQEDSKLGFVRSVQYLIPRAGDDTLPPAELGARCRELDSLAEWLTARLRPRTPREVRTLRFARAGLLLAGVMLAPFLIYSWKNFPRNISAGKAFSVSSTGGPQPASLVVDGVITNWPPFHTNTESNPWFMVDLGAPFLVTDIWVYGPHQCCLTQAVPALVDVSQDGVNFEYIDRKDEPFDEVETWRISKPVRGTVRYVRVRSEGRKSLHLRELAVYGRPAGEPR